MSSPSESERIGIIDRASQNGQAEQPVPANEEAEPAPKPVRVSAAESKRAAIVSMKKQLAERCWGELLELFDRHNCRGEMAAIMQNYSCVVSVTCNQ